MFDFAVDVCRLCSTVFLVLGLSLGVPLGVTLVLTPRRHRMKLIIALLLIVTAGISTAATVTLSGGRGACPYGAIATDAAGNLAVTCAGTVTVVPPVVTTPPPPVITPTPPAVVDPCADLPPSTRAYCRSPGAPPPATGPPAGQPVTPSATVLEAPGGHPIRDAGGDKIYNMPGVLAGQGIEVSVQGGFNTEATGVTVTIRDPSGNVVKNSRNGLGPELLFGGYGIITFVAAASGNYTVELHGGGTLTTLNHWRR